MSWIIIADLIDQAGLDQSFVDQFKEHNITDELISELTTEDLTSLFKQRGDLIKFRKDLNKFNSDNDSSLTDPLPSSSDTGVGSDSNFS